MPTYLVMPHEHRTPAGRFTAPDLISLGEQVAAYLTRHRLLVPGYAYEARIGNDRGAIKQAGRVVTFQITQES